MRTLGNGTRLALGSLLASLACRPGPGEASAPPAEPASDEAVRATMRSHFEQVSAIRDAVIDGDLDTVHELAEVFATEQRGAVHPEAWQPHVLQMIEVAAAAARAPDVPAAAAATASLAASCGDCHRASGARPTFDDALEPAEDDDSLALTMQRHQWAAERLWEGIVGPSEIAWARGSEMFPQLPGCPIGIESEPDFEPRMQQLCTQVGVLGQTGAATRDPKQRTRIYGELLATCAGCHTTGA